MKLDEFHEKYNTRICQDAEDFYFINVSSHEWYMKEMYDICPEPDWKIWTLAIVDENNENRYRLMNCLFTLVEKIKDYHDIKSFMLKEIIETVFDDKGDLRSRHGILDYYHEHYINYAKCDMYESYVDKNNTIRNLPLFYFVMACLLDSPGGYNGRYQKWRVPISLLETIEIAFRYVYHEFHEVADVKACLVLKHEMNKHIDGLFKNPF